MEQKEREMSLRERGASLAIREKKLERGVEDDADVSRLTAGCRFLIL